MGAGRLGGAEALALSKITEANPDAAVKLFTISKTGAIATHEMKAIDVESFQNETLSQDQDAGIYLDAPVSVSGNDPSEGIEPSEQLLFGGKEEFGIDEWNLKYPNADGRGVKVSIVDDGVSQGRPGLTVTSTGEQKIVGIRSQAPEHSLVLRTLGSTCRKEDADVVNAVAAWKIEAKSVPAIETADFKQTFALTGCGISTDTRWESEDCSELKRFVGTGGLTSHAEGRYAGTVAMKDGKVYVLVDFNADGILSDDEVLRPVSEAGGKFKVFPRGEALSFDFSKSSQWANLPSGTNNPMDPSLACNPADEMGILTVKYPETSNTTGSHGEGVASISTGYRIGGRAFDGVAPGAQIVDVQLGSMRRYTISEIARGLQTAGMNGNVVNLSYSLYFSSVESQAAMGRAMNRILGLTDALYFFSAGNNGPGRTSMNRGLLYPSFGVAVGAFLNGRMAQSTFGSAAPIEGVVTYSSRGPGVDGATSAMIISPLAGMYVGPADRGINPFSGTSSATPAMSGFAARVLSQIYAEGLPWNRKMFREALFQSAKPLPNVAFVDQGYGLPNLTRTFEIYKAAVTSTAKSVPSIVYGDIQTRLGGAGSAVNPNGVGRRGILVRGDWDKYDEYVVSLGLSFGPDWSSIEARNYSERVKIETHAPWISRHEDMLLSHSGASFIVALDYSKMTTPGEYLDEIRLIRVSDNKLVQVIPVSVFVAAKDIDGMHSFHANVPARGLARLFVQKPAWAEYALIRRKAATGERLCGRFGVYAPNGLRMSALGSRAGAMLEETAFATAYDGVYEVIPEGRGSHTTCPKDQVMDIEIQWVGLSFTTSLALMSEKDLVLSVQSQSSAPVLSGSVAFSNPTLEYSLPMKAAMNGSFEWENESVDFSKARSVQFALDDALTSKLRDRGGYFYFEYDLTPLDRKASPETLAAGNMYMESKWVSSSKIANKTWPARLSINTFDWTPSAGQTVGFPKVLNLRVREERADLPSAKAEIPVFESLGGQPMSFSVTVKNWGNVTTSNVSMSCKFTPSSFSLAVPCGALSLE